MNEIDAVLMAIENQTRREILKRLAEGRQYALQLAKELKVSQQAVVKHLKALENANLIKNTGTEKSDMGPPRKIYEVNKALSVVIDIGPGIFQIKEYNLDDIDYSVDIKCNDFGEMLEKIEREIITLEKKRAQLLKLKEKIICELLNAEL